MANEGQKAYQEYLKSDTWKLLRKQRLTLDCGECVLCGQNAECVHHRRYPGKWGEETISDLVSLCNTCHAKHHFINSHQLSVVSRMRDVAFFVLFAGDDTFRESVMESLENMKSIGPNGCAWWDTESLRRENNRFGKMYAAISIHKLTAFYEGIANA
jgi:hypothetical protein